MFGRTGSWDKTPSRLDNKEEVLFGKWVRKQFIEKHEEIVNNPLKNS